MNPVAGLVKRAAFLRSLETSGPSLILDAGDIFDEYPDPDLAAHILQVYAELGYDAIAVGDQEFTNGAAGLLEYKSLHGRSDAGTLQAGTSIPAFLEYSRFVILLSQQIYSTITIERIGIRLQNHIYSADC